MKGLKRVSGCLLNPMVSQETFIKHLLYAKLCTGPCEPNSQYNEIHALQEGEREVEKLFWCHFIFQQNQIQAISGRSKWIPLEKVEEWITHAKIQDGPFVLQS